MHDSLSIEQQVIAALRRITRAIDLHSHRLLKQYGLTSPQLAALQAIHRNQPMTAGALAREIHLGQATVTGIVTRLENRGFVSRSRGAHDRRSVVVVLTSEGEKFAEATPSPLQQQFHRELSKLCEWEQTMILATLQRIAEMMDAQDIMDAQEIMRSKEVRSKEVRSKEVRSKEVRSKEVRSKEVLDSARFDATPDLVSDVAGVMADNLSAYLEPAMVPSEEVPLPEAQLPEAQLPEAQLPEAQLQEAQLQGEIAEF